MLLLPTNPIRSQCFYLGGWVVLSRFPLPYRRGFEQSWIVKFPRTQTGLSASDGCHVVINTREDGVMADNGKKNRFEMEDGMLAIWPIVFDSPETRRQLIDALAGQSRKSRTPKMPVKGVVVLKSGAGSKELDALLSGFSDQLMTVH